MTKRIRLRTNEREHNGFQYARGANRMRTCPASRGPLWASDGGQPLQIGAHRFLMPTGYSHEHSGFTRFQAVSPGFDWLDPVSGEMAMMSKEDLINGLCELAQGEKLDSAIARVRDVAPHIEGLLADGYTQRQVWQKLVDKGLTISFGGFKSTVHRLREEVETAGRGRGEFQPSSGGSQTCPDCGKSVLPAACDVGLHVDQQEPPKGTTSFSDAVSNAASVNDSRMHSIFSDVFIEQSKRRC